MHPICVEHQNSATLHEMLTVVHLLPEVCDSEKGFGNYLMKEFLEGDGLKSLLRVMRDPERLRTKQETKETMGDLMEARNRLYDSLSEAGLEIEM